MVGVGQSPKQPNKTRKVSRGRLTREILRKENNHMNLAKINKNARKLAPAFTTTREERGKIYTIIESSNSDIKMGAYDLITYIQKFVDADDNFIRKTVRRALEDFKDWQAKDEEELDNYLTEIKPELYTANLTKWLAESIYHCAYITQVLDDFGADCKDGIQLLGMAHHSAIEEIYRLVIDWLDK